MPDAEVFEEVFGEGVEHFSGVQDEMLVGIPIVSPVSRLIYQPYLLEGTPDGRVLGFLVRDLDSYEVRGGFWIDSSRWNDIATPSSRAGSQLPFAIDPDGQRLFLWKFSDNSFLTIDEQEVLAGDPQPYSEEWTPFGWNLNSPQSDPRSGGLIYSIYDVTYADGNMYVVGQKFGVPGWELTQVDPETGQADWVRPIRSCDGSPYGDAANNNATFGVPVLRTEESFFVPCARGGTSRVVEIPQDSVHDPSGEEHAFPGQGPSYGFLVDEAADRIHIRTHSANVGPMVLTFDAEERAWVGLQQVGEYGVTWSRAAIGLDPTTGRVYTQTTDEDPDSGLNVLEGRWTPVEPGRRFPRYHQSGSPSGSVRVIGVDPETRRLLVPSGGEELEDHEFTVVQDAPPLPEPEDPDPDASTTDVQEEEGVTGRLYSGEASGYGARQLYVGGLGSLSPLAGEGTDSNALLVWEDPHCARRDREFVMARVEGVQLSPSLQGAEASPATADSGTKLDRQQPSRCSDDVGGPLEFGQFWQQVLDALPPWLVEETQQQMDSHAGEEWEFGWASCAPGRPEDETQPDDPHLAGFEAEVSCSPDRVEGSAHAHPSDPGSGEAGDLPVVRVGSAWSRTSSYLDPDRGLVSVSESVAEGIEIGGVIHIAGVYAKAETWSKGRPGTNETSFERKIWGVATPDFSCDLCTDGEDLADGLSRALGDRGEVRVPDPDPTLAEGTPGGYQAAVQREFFESLTMRLMNGDTFQEVPGLEVVFYHDHPEGPRRPIYQFAGVLANSQYGIYCLLGQAPDGSCNEPSAPSAPPPPPTTMGGGTEDDGGAAGPVESAEDEFFEEIIQQPSGSAQQPASGMAPVAAREPGSGAEAAPPQSAPEQLYRAIEEGVQWVLRDPKEAALSGLMWLLLAAPFYLVWRRRLLNGFVSRPAS